MCSSGHQKLHIMGTGCVSSRLDPIEFGWLDLISPRAWIISCWSVSTRKILTFHSSRRRIDRNAGSLPLCKEVLELGVITLTGFCSCKKNIDLFNGFPYYSKDMLFSKKNWNYWKESKNKLKASIISPLKQSIVNLLINLFQSFPVYIYFYKVEIVL